MQRSLNDFFAKNKKRKSVKRKHDSNSDDNSADPNNNVTNVSETVQIMHSKQQQIEILFHMLKKKNIYKNLTFFILIMISHCKISIATLCVLVSK